MVRKRASKGKGKAKGPRRIDRKDATIKKWNKASDIPMDEEDEFHASRDRILLEGDDVLSSDEQEEEVFGLKGLSDTDSDEDDVEDEGIADEDAEDIDHPSKKPRAKASKKAKKSVSAPSTSSSGSEESEEEGWGGKKSAYYSSNAAIIESDDEEANELEEQEARRLQAKARASMSEADFGLDDIAEVTAAADEEMDPLAEASAVVPVPQDKRDIVRHLEKTSPETLALARDWEDTAYNLVKAQEKIAALQQEDPDALKLGMIHLHYQTLLTYATTLAFYLHLRASPKYASKPDSLRKHPVFARLLTLKRSLATLEDLDFGISDDDDLDSEEDEELDDSMEAEQLWHFAKKKGLDMDDLKLLLSEAAQDLSPGADGVRLDSEKTQPPAKKRKINGDGKDPSSKAKKSKKATPLKLVFDLVEPTYGDSQSTAASTVTPEPSADMFGEFTSLQHADASDKSARRKTLRFHTSRIESAGRRRDGARSGALGGDDDVPYRERQREKEARLARENAKKGLGLGGEDLDMDMDDGLEVGAGGKRKRRGDDEGDDDEEGADGYYELVKKKAKQAKQQKKEVYDATKAAARPQFEEDTANGPRAPSRAILKNKGLTPRRSKESRNPRVKKRKRFEKATKKVASQKAIYRGGEGKRYEGERSGISKVAKGVRLG